MANASPSPSFYALALSSMYDFINSPVDVGVFCDDQLMTTDVRYFVGVDVGTHSIGFAAIRVSDDDTPLEVLNALSLIHDSGLDPAQMKTATTRLAASGVARRTRRLVRRRRKRLVDLDHLLTEWGWPLTEAGTDPYEAWHARARLATERVTNEPERHRLLSIAVRHIARHRGWRNPYSRVESLLTPVEPSAEFINFKQRAERESGKVLPESATVGQIVAATAANGRTKLRGDGGILGARLMQSDNANELHRIFDIQQVADDTRRALILKVFQAESPRGSAAGRAGKDPLPGQRRKPRASKASDAFQRYRIASIVTNLRVRERGMNEDRPLTIDERRQAYEFLINAKVTADPIWADIAECIGIDRSQLRGTASQTADGDRAAARPPLHMTDRLMRTSKLKPLTKWWDSAARDEREALIEALSNSGQLSEESPGATEAQEFLRTLDDDDLAKLDTLHLAAGRAAYSEDSLRRLTQRMLSTEDDLHAARMHEFRVPADWAPPAEAIGARVGNPAVDRVTKAVSRWIHAAEAEWGAPSRIVIEHVRSGFVSEKQARDVDTANNRRAQANRKIAEEIHTRSGTSGSIRRSDITRYLAIQRQNGECLYCGDPIDYVTAEIDHIVPQAGLGSTNYRENLAAVCRGCNRSKSNTPFAVWAQSCDEPGVSLEDALERTRFWNVDPGSNRRDHNRFVKEVQARLRRTTEDPEFDGRSLESVAWMANELRHRIQEHFRVQGTNTEVAVYRGALTAEARRASGIEKRLRFIGGTGKSRLDRRHHAVDAAVITLTDASIAKTLAWRTHIRQTEWVTRENETWKEFEGASPTSITRFRDWRQRMQALSELLSDALDEDSIPVTENLRLRLANGAAHMDTIQKFDARMVGDEIPEAIIDRASTPALWCALTRHEDFVPGAGLPENPSRCLRVHGRKLGADTEIQFFATPAAAIAVRGGYAEIGNTIHHARIFRIDGGAKPVFAMLRVFAVDLLPHRRTDLFSAPIPPHSISMRNAEPKLRRAIAEGNATELGWLVVGDELLLKMAEFGSGQIGGFLEAYPDTTRWKIEGFNSESKLRLRPVLLAAEGIPEDATDPVKKTVNRPGWRLAVNALFQSGQPTIVRRDALGRPRLVSAAGLPVSWSVGR